MAFDGIDQFSLLQMQIATQCDGTTVMYERFMNALNLAVDPVKGKMCHKNFSELDIADILSNEQLVNLLAENAPANEAKPLPADIGWGTLDDLNPLEKTKVNDLTDRAMDKYNELAGDDEMGLFVPSDGEPKTLLALAEWVWCSLRPGQSISAQDRDTEASKILRKCGLESGPLENAYHYIMDENFEHYYQGTCAAVLKFHNEQAALSAAKHVSECPPKSLQLWKPEGDDWEKDRQDETGLHPALVTCPLKKTLCHLFFTSEFFLTHFFIPSSVHSHGNRLASVWQVCGARFLSPR